MVLLSSDFSPTNTRRNELWVRRNACTIATRCTEHPSHSIGFIYRWNFAHIWIKSHIYSHFARTRARVSLLSINMLKRDHKTMCVATANENTARIELSCLSKLRIITVHLWHVHSCAEFQNVPRFTCVGQTFAFCPSYSHQSNDALAYTLSVLYKEMENTNIPWFYCSVRHLLALHFLSTLHYLWITCNIWPCSWT